MESTEFPSIDETIRRQFESDCNTRWPNRIEDYLPAENDPRFLATLEELILIEMEFAWKRFRGLPIDERESNRPSELADYVERFPKLADAKVLGRLVLEECAFRRSCGEDIEPTDYVNNFKQLDDLPDDFWQRMDTIPVGGDANGDGTGVFGRYEVVAEQGRGGFATVWRAIDPKLGREVALKQLNENLARRADLRNRFLIEARIAARLEHPGIVPVHDMGRQEDGRPYYTMKLVRGETLAVAINRMFEEHTDDVYRSVDFRRLLNSFVAVCRTMEYAHSNGVLHRDLKPQNIVVGRYGETIILDWGLAKIVGESSDEDSAGFDELDTDVDATQAGEIKGTPAFMSPEQAGGLTDEVDERSDIYALGVILYVLLTGKLPFRGNRTDDVLRQVVAAEPIPVSSLSSAVPKPLEAVCDKAMRKKADDRYQSVAELTADVERYLNDEPVTARREPWTARAGRWMRRHRAITASSIVGLLLITVATAVGLVLKDRADQREQAQAEEIDRREEQRIAGLRQYGDLALAAARDDIRKSRFVEAKLHLEEAIERIGDDPELAERKALFVAMRERAGQLVTFYEQHNRAFEFAYLERDILARTASHAALQSVGTFRHADWWLRLPADDLTVTQIDRLQQDVYWQLMMFAALQTKQLIGVELPNLMLGRTTDSMKQRARSILAVVEQLHRFRLSDSGRLMETFCRYLLDPKNTSLPEKVDGRPLNAADYYFQGLVYFYVSQSLSDPTVSLVVKLIGSKIGLPKNLLKKSQEYLQEAARLEPGNFWVNLFQGLADESRGDLATARRAYDFCIMQRPEHYLAYSARAQVQLRMARRLNATRMADAKKKGLRANDVTTRQAIDKLIADSQRDIDTARQYNATEPELFWVRGSLLTNLPSHLQFAVRAFHSALDLEGPSSQLRGRTGQIRKLGRKTQKTWAESMVRAYPDDVDLAVYLARLLWEVDGPKSIDRAGRLVQGVIDRNPNHAYAYLIRGIARQQKDDHEAALRDFRSAFEFDVLCVPALYRTAMSLEHLGRHNQANAAYERFQQRAVSNWQKREAHLGRCRMLLALKQPESAAVALTAAITADPYANLDRLRQAAEQAGAKTIVARIANYKPQVQKFTVTAPPVRVGHRVPLINGGFELGFIGRHWGVGQYGGNKLVWWVSRGSASSAHGTRRVKHSGMHSLHVVSRSDFKEHRYGTTVQDVPIVPNATYRITFYARARNLARVAGLIVFDTTWKKAMALPPGTYDWKKVEGRFRLPTNVANIRILAQGQGEFWIDDMEITLEKLP